MEGGLNSFIEEQKQFPGQALLTLAQFDDEYEIVHPIMDIKDVPAYTLTPRGFTALLDGIGKFITEVGEQLSKKPEDERPGKVIICIVTDGGENASKEWKDPEQVKKLIKQQQDEYQWEIIFLGANIDAVRTAQGMGIHARSAMTYDVGNARGVYAMASSNVSAMRGGAVNVQFTDDQRQQAMKKEKSKS